MPSWLSLTITSSAPPASAPSIAALTSARHPQPGPLVFRCRDGFARPAYSGGVTCTHETTPQVPSISAEIKNLHVYRSSGLSNSQLSDVRTRRPR